MPHSEGSSSTSSPGDVDSIRVHKSDGCQCRRISDLENELRESEKRWQSRIARLEDGFRANEVRLQSRIEGLGREVALLRRNASLNISMAQLRSGDRIGDAVVLLADQVKLLDRATAQVVSQFDALQSRADYAHTFPQFTRLPLELREMIWAFAMPRRVASMTRNFRSWGVAHGPPAIAHACHESRRVACRTGVLICRSSKESWFDFRYDTLRMEATGKWKPKLSLPCQVLRRVLLAYDNIGVISCLPSLFHPANFPQLQVIQFELISRSFIEGQITTVGEEDIFGQTLEETLYLDVDDEVAIQKITDQLRKRPGFQPSADTFLRNIESARNEWYVWADGIGAPAPTDSWVAFKCWLEQYWLDSWQRNTPLTSKVMVVSSGTRRQVKWDHPWVQSMKKQIPLIQRVGKIERGHPLQRIYSEI